MAVITPGPQSLAASSRTTVITSEVPKHGDDGKATGLLRILYQQTRQGHHVPAVPLRCGQLRVAPRNFAAPPPRAPPRPPTADVQTPTARVPKPTARPPAAGRPETAALMAAATAAAAAPVAAAATDSVDLPPLPPPPLRVVLLLLVLLLMSPLPPPPTPFQLLRCCRQQHVQAGCPLL